MFLSPFEYQVMQERYDFTRAHRIVFWRDVARILHCEESTAKRAHNRAICKLMMAYKHDEPEKIQEKLNKLE